jgi:hypothetical protein
MAGVLKKCDLSNYIWTGEESREIYGSSMKEFRLACRQKILDWNKPVLRKLGDSLFALGQWIF